MIFSAEVGVKEILDSNHSMMAGMRTRSAKSTSKPIQNPRNLVKNHEISYSCDFCGGRSW
jgi:hypothetical protein